MIAECRQAVERTTSYNGKPILFSREHLTHEIFNKGLVAERLHAVFGTFKVILTIREQRSMLESAYLWHKRGLRHPWSGGIPHTSFDAYLSAHRTGLTQIGRRSRLSTGDYGAIARHYAHVVGRENVGVFLFEEMVRSPDVFCENLFGFLSVDPKVAEDLLKANRVNSRSTKREYYYWGALAYLLPLPVNRIVQRLVPNTVLRVLSSGAPMKVSLSSESEKFLANFYRDGNRYLQSEFSLPLEKYGYAL
jgi:hypothetical protein